MTGASATTALPLPVWVAPALLLLAAVAPLPYGYYEFLRLVICGCVATGAFLLWRSHDRSFAPWAFGGLALLYNPLFRIHLDREIWSPINLISAALLVFLGLNDRRRATGRRIRE